MDCTATSTSHINLGTGLYLPALYQMYYLPVNLVVFRGTQVSKPGSRCAAKFVIAQSSR